MAWGSVAAAVGREAGGALFYATCLPLGKPEPLGLLVPMHATFVNLKTGVGNRGYSWFMHMRTPPSIYYSYIRAFKYTRVHSCS